MGKHHIYWGIQRARSGSWIGRERIDGTHVNQSFIEAQGPGGVAVGSDHVYWLDGTADGFAIGRARLDGTGVERSFIPVVEPANAHDVAVDARHLYWTWNSGLEGWIGRARLDGTHVNQRFAPAAHDTAGLAVSGSHIYWGDNSTGAIGRARIDGTHDKSLIDVGSIGSLAVDAGSTRPPKITELRVRPKTFRGFSPELARASAWDADRAVSRPRSNGDNRVEAGEPDAARRQMWPVSSGAR